MNTATLTKTNGGEILLSGILDVTTVPHLWEQSKPLFNAILNSIQIDLSAVTHCDSSGVALLIAWQQYVRKACKQIRFLHLPATMQAIIHVSDLEKILSV